MKRVFAGIFLTAWFGAAFADDVTDSAKHAICQKHPPSGPYSKLKWPAGFESCEASEKAWATSHAKKLEDEKADREALDQLNKSAAAPLQIGPAATPQPK